MTENMDIWNKVCTTDPEHTKKVEQRGGFTAIDAYSQIQKATEIFGPVGRGWKWEVLNTHFTPQDQIILEVELRWDLTLNKGGAGRFTVFGQCSLMFGDKPDKDAAKKALTDAITKGLSYLGFNADVFLGKFDDNKYVEKLKKAGKEKPKGVTALKEKMRALAKEIRSFDGQKKEDAGILLLGLDKLFDDSKELLAEAGLKLSTEWHDGAIKAFEEMTDKLGGPSTDPRI